MNHLRTSPYVLDVSAGIMHFSAKFKALFWNSMQEEKVKYLEPQLSYKDQEIEFLKKLYL